MWTAAGKVQVTTSGQAATVPGTFMLGLFRNGDIRAYASRTEVCSDRCEHRAAGLSDTEPGLPPARSHLGRPPAERTRRFGEWSWCVCDTRVSCVVCVHGLVTVCVCVELSRDRRHQADPATLSHEATARMCSDTENTGSLTPGRVCPGLAHLESGSQGPWLMTPGCVWLPRSASAVKCKLGRASALR